MADESEIRVAVVTGGHSYEVPSFHALFRGLDGVDAYVQHMDDFASSPQDVREGYDVVVFYIMLTEGPTDEGLPWYAGTPLEALSHLGETGQGIFVMHHALLAYPQWDKWSEIVGIGQRTTFDYHFDEQVRIQVAAPGHPVTAGLSDWDMIDETYEMADCGKDSELLLTSDHPKSMRTIAWTRTHDESRVFCWESGHDNQTWVNESFRTVLRRGIEWCARRI